VSEVRATTDGYINVQEYGNANASTLGPVPSFGAVLMAESRFHIRPATAVAVKSNMTVVISFHR